MAIATMPAFFGRTVAAICCWLCVVWLVVGVWRGGLGVGCVLMFVCWLRVVFKVGGAQESY